MSTRTSLPLRGDSAPGNLVAFRTLSHTRFTYHRTWETGLGVEIRVATLSPDFFACHRRVLCHLCVRLAPFAVNSFCFCLSPIQKSTTAVLRLSFRAKRGICSPRRLGNEGTATPVPDSLAALPIHSAQIP